MVLGEMKLLQILAFYLIGISLVSMVLMWMDKQKAIYGSWRIKEKTLFAMAALGGALGIYIGMNIFRHKTKHLRFSIGIPIILIINVVMSYWIVQVLTG